MQKEKKYAYHVCQEVNAKNSNCTKRKRNIGNNEHEEGRNFRNITSQCIGNRFFQVVKY